LISKILFISLTLLHATVLSATVYHNNHYNNLKSASELDYPPFSIVTDGKADGFSVELLRNVVKEMGGDVTFQIDEWNKIKDALKNGDIDLLPLVGRTPEREEYFDFSIPYLILHGTVIIRADEKNITKFSDLKNRVLATMKGDSAHEYIQREKLGSKIILTADFETALKELSSGKYDAVVMQKLVATKMIKKLKLSNLKNVNFPLDNFQQDFSFAVREGNKELLAYLNEGLSLVMANGVHKQLHDKWFANLDDLHKDYTNIIYLISGLAILLFISILIILVWNYSLNKVLKTKTKELQDSKELYKNFFDNSPSANIIYSSEDYGNTFKIEQVNRALENLENLKAEEIEGKLLHDVFKGVENSQIYKKFQDVYKSGKSIHDPTSLIKLADKDVWRENFIFKLQTGEVVSSYIDHTKEKNLEEDILYNHEKTLLSLINLIEYRDSYTGGHSLRVATYSKMVATAMGFSDQDCEKIYRAGILHDIGKIVTPDAILLKPNSLNQSEYELIKTHSSTGANILKDIPMYKDVSQIVLAHHERYDGSGYPNALKGDEIHPMAQIMSVCDSFDAMTTNRIYRGHKTIDEAVAEIKSLSNIHFHKNVVDIAVKVLSHVVLNENINQLPNSELENRRFSFFYRDQVTQAYNSEYLNLILKDNTNSYEYKCLNVILVHGFASYNSRYGWSEGDKLLFKIADVLQKKFKNSLVFRLHGDDFIVINKEHVEIIIEELEELLEIKEFKITIENIHFNIENEHLDNIQALEEHLIKMA
jgi:putative nucleotidyltransferase with HDIG domain/diguanylate cyclase (GGDEF)-like protein